VPYLSASEMVFHEEELYQVYVPLFLPLSPRESLSTCFHPSGIRGVHLRSHLCAT